MNKKKPVYVTRPDLPPFKEYADLLKQIWETKIITNNGPFHQHFERALAEYLGVKYISLFANGTIALITALQALKISGEVITTPFSFVATTHALWWNNITPVFADIEPDTFNLDPEKAEAAITPKTTAIMPVHVYGNPCDVERFQRISGRHNIRIIYDAAHAFGVYINGKSVLNFGDLSVLSFHATKTFNTIEGGAIVCHDKKMKDHIDLLKNFGFAGETSVLEPGINGKMNEFQAAFGLLQLKYIDNNISKRRSIAETYRKMLYNIEGIRFLEDIEGVRHGYPYFPVLIDQEKFGRSRDEVYEELKKHDIFGRRYFYPLISQIPSYKNLSSSEPSNLPIAEKISRQILCLPIFPDLKLSDVIRICNLLDSQVKDK